MSNLKNTVAEKRYLDLQKDRQFAVNILAQLALQLIEPKNAAFKPDIEAKIKEAALILNEIDKESISLVDAIDSKLIISLLHG